MNSYNIISEHKNPSTASYELFNRIGSDMFYIGFQLSPALLFLYFSTNF